jgi:hypothetical protein
MESIDGNSPTGDLCDADEFRMNMMSEQIFVTAKCKTQHIY